VAAALPAGCCCWGGGALWRAVERLTCCSGVGAEHRAPLFKDSVVIAGGGTLELFMANLPRFLIPARPRPPQRALAFSRPPQLL